MLRTAIYLLLISVLPMPVVAANIFGYPADRSVLNTYTDDWTGFNQALIDAAHYQDVTKSCAQYTSQYFITLPAGATTDLNGSTLNLPQKQCGQYVTIQSDKYNNLTPRGTRVNPATDSTYMARVQSTLTPPAGFQTMITFATGVKTRYWRFRGLDLYGVTGNFAGDSGYLYLIYAAETGSNYPSSTDPGLNGDHIEVDHCWFHGLPYTGNVAVGFGSSANNTRILDSYFDNIFSSHNVYSYESHGTLGNLFDNGFEVRNNYINAGSENSFIGGAWEPAGLLPSDIKYIGNKYDKEGYYNFHTDTITTPTWPCRPNYIYRNTAGSPGPIDWFCNNSGTWVSQGGIATGGVGLVKNQWEIKMGRKVKVFGNEMAGIWDPDGQQGSQAAEAFVFNLTSQPPGIPPLWVFPSTPLNPTVLAQPWTTTEDIDIKNNVIHDSVAFFSLGFPSGVGTVCADPSPSVPCYFNSHHNINVVNNLSYNMSDSRGFTGGVYAGNGFFGIINIADYNINVSHNTYLVSTFDAASGQMGKVMSNNSQGLAHDIILANNIMPIGFYGMRADPHDAADAGICNYFQLLASGASYTLGGFLITYADHSWPSSTPIATPPPPLVPGCSTFALWPTGTLTPVNGAAAVDESTPTYKVKAPFQNSATDGTDSGANIDMVNWATAGTSSGAPNPYLDFQIRGQKPITGGTIVYASALDNTACTAVASASLTFSSPTSGSVGQIGRDLIITFTGLTNDHGYYTKITCNSKYITGEIVTGH